jgi:hypothetical protein
MRFALITSLVSVLLVLMFALVLSWKARGLLETKFQQSGLDAVRGLAAAGRTRGLAEPGWQARRCEGLGRSARPLRQGGAGAHLQRLHHDGRRAHRSLALRRELRCGE